MQSADPTVASSRPAASAAMAAGKEGGSDSRLGLCKEREEGGGESEREREKGGGGWGEKGRPLHVRVPSVHLLALTYHSF